MTEVSHLQTVHDWFMISTNAAAVVELLVADDDDDGDGCQLYSWL